MILIILYGIYTESSVGSVCITTPISMYMYMLRLEQSARGDLRVARMLAAVRTFPFINPFPHARARCLRRLVALVVVGLASVGWLMVPLLRGALLLLLPTEL